MKKVQYIIPITEEQSLSLEALLAQSPRGNLDDMPGDDIFFN